METAFTILSAIGGDGDIIEEALPLWQRMVPYLCFAYAQIVLWIAAMTRMLPYKERDGRLNWSVLVFFIPLLGALFTVYAFRYSKYKNVPTVKERTAAEKKAAVIADREQASRDAEARESFKPFES